MTLPGRCAAPGVKLGNFVQGEVGHRRSNTAIHGREHLLYIFLRGGGVAPRLGGVRHGKRTFEGKLALTATTKQDIHCPTPELSRHEVFSQFTYLTVS